MARTVFFSAGEASGDRYATELAQRLTALDHNLQITGIGGKKFEQVAQSTFSSADWGAVGILESLKVVPKAIRGFRWAKKRLKTEQPGLFVPIDYGYLNIRLARLAKECGWKVLYFIPPGSWRRDKQGADLPQVTDEIVTPFPWSADILNQMGATAHYFGHPLKQMVAQAPSATKDRTGIAVLPGSRMHEVAHNLPVIARALNQINLDEPAKFAVASNLDSSQLQKEWSRHTKIHAEFSSKTYAVLKSARAAVVCSGTATLESALCQCPTVVMYRGSKWTEIEYRIRKPKFDYISLPNILLDQPVLPELIQWDATPEAVAKHLQPLLNDSDELKKQLTAFTQLEASLGPTDSLEQTTQLITTLTP